jgi:integrase
MNDLVVVERLPDWQRLKALVLDSVSSPITRRVYNMALEEFMGWYKQAPRPGFSKATVSAWRASLETRGLGSSSIIIRMSAIRKLAGEAADNGLLASDLAAGISRVKSVKSTGIRVGNWLSLRQAQALLSAPDAATTKGLRDRAILAFLIGCGLRRSEVAALMFTHIQQRDDRWCIVDLVRRDEDSPLDCDTFLSHRFFLLAVSAVSTALSLSIRVVPECPEFCDAAPRGQAFPELRYLPGVIPCRLKARTNELSD